MIDCETNRQQAPASSRCTGVDCVGRFLSSAAISIILVCYSCRGMGPSSTLSCSQRLTAMSTFSATSPCIVDWQDRLSLSRHQSTGESVRIEAFAHGAIGGESVLVASLSNSVLLVVRIGGRKAQDIESGSLRSWLLEWPVQGKIKGLCVSPDLACVLCVTEDLEGVYILAINNLEAEDGHKGSPVRRENDVIDTAKDVSRKAEFDTSGRDARGTPNSAASTTAATAPGPSARPPQRAAASSAFPSLLHLASRGQRRKAGGGVPHPPAEPVFIASLARRAGASGKGSLDEGGWGGGNRRSSVPGRVSSGGGGGRSRHGSRSGATQLECLWWVTRNGDHVAIIGRPDGEVHFLDLERLHSWVVTPPHPAGHRGRVCALTIESLSPLAPPPPVKHPTDEGTQPEQQNEEKGGVVSTQVEDPDPRHLVTVLETGAVFVVLLERGRPDSSSSGSAGAPRTEAEEAKAEEENDNKGNDNDLIQHSRGASETIEPLGYDRLGADNMEDPEFAPTWVDVGRGSSGGGGGGWGVRVMPIGGSAGQRKDGAENISPNVGLRMSIVSRAWGNKCTVKMLGLASNPDRMGGNMTGQARDKNQGRPQALRLDTIRQVNLPVDHPAPERHALAVVNGEWAILASPPAGSTPARVTVAALANSERPAPGSVRLIPLPAGERVGGVALLSIGQRAESASDSGRTPMWGLVWSDAGIYRVDLREPPRPPTVGDSGVDVPLPSSSRPPSPPPPLPPPPPPPLPPPRTKGSLLASGGLAASRTIRRPSPAAVTRARELYSSGDLSEAVRVALDALDGNRMSGASGSMTGNAAGKQETGGGLTTRMVREDLANSLLEWLVILHTRQSDPMTRKNHASRTAPASSSEFAGGNITGIHGAVAGVQGGERLERDRRPRAGSPQNLRASPRRGAKYFASARLSRRESGDKASGNTSRVAAQRSTPVASSRLEQFLLSSFDYDPLRAATLLQAHGQADLAIIAGVARGDAALAGVIIILAESPWPPRLGFRAVQSLCAIGKAREIVRVGGGTLFAALEPSLRIRILISDHRIVFHSLEDENPGSTSITPVLHGGKPTPLADLRGNARCCISPNLPALSVTELAEVCSRLAQWCNGELLQAGCEDARSLGTSISNAEGCLDCSPSSSAREAVAVFFDVLLELIMRDPPPGAAHRRAWLEAGCTSGCVRDQESSIEGAVTSIGAATGGDGVVEGPAEANARSSHWPSIAAALCRILQQRGISGRRWQDVPGGPDGQGVEGGLPTAARRVLLSALPLLQGWYDPVSVMLKVVGGGCWAAVALQLDLWGHRQEAASAKLHGVVAFLQGGDNGAPGETMRILSGAEPPRGPPKVLTDIIGDDARKTSIAHLLQIIDDFVFPGGTAAACDPSAAHVSPRFSSQPKAEDIPARGHAVVSDDGEEIVARASVLAQVVCIWRRFGLPVVSLEAALRPRLAERDSARVLTALFYPQLCSGASRGEAKAPWEELGNRLGIRAGAADRSQDSSGPTQAQVNCAESLGLSPRFQLALVQAGARVAALDSHRSLETGAGMRPGSSSPSSVQATKTARERSSTVPSAAALASDRYGLPLSALAVLLETRRSDGGASSAWLGSSADANGTKYDGRRGSRSGAGGSSGLSLSTTASSRRGSALVVDENTVVFSCGHSYARDQLWRIVVPACVSSLHHATSSLQRTEQILVREYHRRGSVGAACPECAAKDLRRLVSGLRPLSLAFAGGGTHDFPITKSMSAPANHPTWASFLAPGRTQP